MNVEQVQLVRDSLVDVRPLADRIADGVIGKPSPPNRPVVAGLTHVTPPIRDRSNYNDFVRAEAERHDSELILIGRGILHETMGRLRTHSYSIIRQAQCPVLSV